MVPWGKNEEGSVITWSHPGRLDREGEVPTLGSKDGQGLPVPRKWQALATERTSGGIRENGVHSLLSSKAKCTHLASLQWQGNYNRDVCLHSLF